MHNIKYVVFDFDGTIADSRTVFLSLYNNIAERYGYITIQESNLEYLRTLSIIERSKFLKVPLYRIPLMVMEFTKNYRKYIPQLTVYPGIKEMLFDLKDQGYKLAIISTNSVKNISAFLDQQQIDVFDDIISANLFGKHHSIHKFLSKYRLSPKELLYVGDESRDIIACKKCEVSCVWVSWGYDVEETIKKDAPNYIVHTADAIVSVLSSK